MGRMLCALLVVFASLAVAQDAKYEAAFDRAYWLSKPAEVRVMETMDRSIGDARVRVQDKAVDLVKRGYIIDHAIMVWGFGPYNAMLMRKQLGFTWVPSALQPNLMAMPGLSTPGQSMYDPDRPPAGSIKVSINVEDYPAFDPPAPVSVANTAPSVGMLSFGCVYYVSAGDSAKDGERVTDGRGTFTKHVVRTPVAQSVWYTLDSCK